MPKKGLGHFRIFLLVLFITLLWGFFPEILADVLVWGALILFVLMLRIGLKKGYFGTRK